jgi:hypothetical protein
LAKDERERLAKAMSLTQQGQLKDVVLCPDENFHGPHICLVAIEPVSNFIVVETYAPCRDADTWYQAFQTGLAGLPVHVVCVTSDQAKALPCLADKLLVPHQPELMHLQHNLAGPLLLPLTRPVKEANKELDKALKATAVAEQACGPEPDSAALDELIAAVKADMAAKRRVEQASQHLQECLAPLKEIGTLYHPFERQSGATLTAEAMHSRLQAVLDKVDKVICQEGLGERARQALSRARVWAVTLVGGLAWWWSVVYRRMAELDLSEAAETVFVTRLVAGYYWGMASVKEQDPQERARLKGLSDYLLEEGWWEHGAMGEFEESERTGVERMAQACAGLFQRSSSCVEGRNSRLSLFHHGQTRLSEARLRALTAVHNYVVKRADGSTAAERFFGHKQSDAFDWLLQALPDLPRPAAKRPKKAGRPRLAAA